MNFGKLMIGLIILGILLRVVILIWSGGTMVDDAYISLRYAKNLIEGKGLVYNEGHHVLGISAPLYAIWLALILLLSQRIDPGYAVGMAHIAVFAITAYYLFRLTLKESGRVAMFVILLFAIYLPFVDNSTIGMETPLFVMGMAISLVLFEQGRISLLSLLLVIMVLIRPEGVLWILSISAALLIRRQRIRPLALLPGVAAALVWVVFSLLYYGSVIPNSVLAKSGWVVPYDQSALSWIGSAFASLSLVDIPHRLYHHSMIRIALVLVALIPLPLFLLGWRKLLREKSVLVSLPILYVSYLAFYLLGRGRLEFSWYGIPSGLAYVTTVVIGIPVAMDRLHLRSINDTRYRILIVSCALILSAGSITLWKTTRLPYYRGMRESFEKAGEYVDQHADPNARVMIYEIGMIGYRSNRFVYDMCGLVSPEVLKYYKESNYEFTVSGFLREFEPDMLVYSTARLMNRSLSVGDAEWVRTHYERVAQFPLHLILKKI